MVNLQRNNPKGYNKYKKNPIQPPTISKLDVQESYREMLRVRREYMSKVQKYNYLFKKFLELDQIDKEEGEK